MATVVGTFVIEDGFFSTGRGLVLAGVLSGQVRSGYQIVFANTTEWLITGVNFINVRNQPEKVGLLVDAPLTSREELIRYAIIGTTVQLLAA